MVSTGALAWTRGRALAGLAAGPRVPAPRAGVDLRAIKQCFPSEPRALRLDDRGACHCGGERRDLDLEAGVLSVERVYSQGVLKDCRKRRGSGAAYRSANASSPH